MIKLNSTFSSVTRPGGNVIQPPTRSLLGMSRRLLKFRGGSVTLSAQTAFLRSMTERTTA
jgi:hypothetical protein